MLALKPMLAYIDRATLLYAEAITHPATTRDEVDELIIALYAALILNEREIAASEPR